MMDRDRVMQCMFDEETMPALAALEGGSRTISQLADEACISVPHMREKLAYLVECNLLNVEGDVYTANADKLASIMEDDGHYDVMVDAVTKMDSYLN